ncbi:hypothetical protein GGF46_001256 [Coemansia sp. RSA 552]|nr:hypothetical protein GGF46_001256 [Coemansia sp. RSA 552]
MFIVTFAICLLLLRTPVVAAGGGSGEPSLLNAYSSGLLEYLRLYDPGAGNASFAALSPAARPRLAAHKQPDRAAGDRATSCFSLKKSRHCGGWLGDYYMSPLVTVDGRHVTNAEELDAVMDGYFGSPHEYSYINRFFGCHSWEGQEAPRYRISYTCRSLLESGETKKCNGKRAPPALCGSTCDAYVRGWSALTANHSLCIDNAVSEDRRRSLAKGCQSWPYNGTANCIASIESSAEICGFSAKEVANGELDALAENERLCRFCKEVGGSCCLRTFAMLACGASDTRSVQLRGLAIAMGLLLSVVCLLVVWVFYRWIYARQASARHPPKDHAGHCSSSRGSGPSEGESVVTFMRSPARSNSQSSTARAQSGSRVAMGSQETAASRALGMPGAARLPAIVQSIFHRHSRHRATGPGLAAAAAEPEAAQRLTIAKREQSLRGHPELKGEGDVGPGPACPIQRDTVPGLETHSERLSGEEESQASASEQASGSEEEPVFTVQFPYSPAESDELSITPGEKVRVLRVFSDGWAFVERAEDSEVGAIPVVCLDV